MAAKYEIVLLCGHHKIAFLVADNKTSDYYCYICHKEVDRDMTVKAKRISVGVTGN